MTLGEEYEQLHRQIAALEAELAAERARLDFLISIMNCWDMFDACHEAWHPTKRTSQLRATVRGLPTTGGADRLGRCEALDSADRAREPK